MFNINKVTGIFLLLIVMHSIGVVHRVEKRVYAGPGKKSPKVSVTYTDALGRVLQSQIKMNSDNYMVAGNYWDVLGRDSISVKAYMSNTKGVYQDVSDFAMIAHANKYYDGSTEYRPDAECYAYKEVLYKTDGEIKDIGGYGNTWRIGGIGNNGKKWVFPINVVNANKKYFTVDGFIKEEYLLKAVLDEELTPLVRGKLDLHTDPNFRGEVVGMRTNTDKFSPTCKFSYGEDQFSFGGHPPFLVYLSDNWGIEPVRYDPTRINEFDPSGISSITPLELGDIVYVTKHSDQGALSDQKVFMDGNETPVLGENYYILSELGWVHYSTNFDHVLVVSMSNEGTFSQGISDVSGFSKKKWRSIENNIDPSDNCIAEEVTLDDTYSHITIPPENLSPKINSRYSIINLAGQTCLKSDSRVITENSQINENTFDKYNRICFSRDSELKYLGKFSVIEYDQFNRIVGAYIYNGSHSFHEPNGFNPTADEKEYKIKTIYDTLTIDNLKELLPFVADQTISVLHADLKNQNGHLAGKVAYNPEKRNVIELFSYDVKGHITDKIKIIPGIPIQKTSFVTNLLGSFEKVVVFAWDKKTHTWNKILEKNYTYNADDQLISMSTNNNSVVYEYADNGFVISKSFYEKDDLIDKITYEYDISENLLGTKTMSGVFNEKLYFEKSPSSSFTEHVPRFDGHITASEVSGKTSQADAAYGINLSYKYSSANRLTEVINQASSGSAKDLNLNASYSYDKAGRFSTKKEGTDNLANYTYSAGSSTLTSVKSKKGTTSPEVEHNFVYNKNGAMVVDKQKNMVIHYNWKNKPESIYFYNKLPIDVSQKWRSENFSSGDIKLLQIVKMVYDANGSRVQKLLYKVEQGE